MTVHRVAEVKAWIDSMNIHLENAIRLSRRMNDSSVNDAHDLFWALVKYAENVQECIIQLDTINSTILPALDEIPQKDNPDPGFSWAGMKGMRQRLAHDFRNIDPKVLWQTVTYDFPILLSLTSHIILAEAGSTQNGMLGVKFNAGDFRSLPAFQEQIGFKPGNSMVALFFDGSRKAQCIRFARVDDRTIKYRPSEGVTLTGMAVSLIDQDGTAEHLGSWTSPAVSTNI